MASEIEIHQPSTAVAVPGSPSVDLRAWADQAAAAYTYADAVCRTQMVPAAYKGKPDEACAAILAGAELGFGPMASLRAFHPINGTPAPAAITLRAVVTGHGHEVVVEESSGTRAVVSGRRKGADTWQTSVWDIERASKLPQYATNKNYQHNPGAMLVARATAEVCRWIASDAIMGMPYAAEEIDDQPALSPSPVARKLTLADLEPEPEPTRTPEWLPSDDEPITDHQVRTMFALWGDLGFSGDANRAQRLEVTGKILGLTDLQTSKNLTQSQADTVIAALRERLAQVAPAEVPGGAE